jgi:hypothetical protein
MLMPQAPGVRKASAIIAAAAGRCKESAGSEKKFAGGGGAHGQMGMYQHGTKVPVPPTAL